MKTSPITTVFNTNQIDLKKDEISKEEQRKLCRIKTIECLEKTYSISQENVKKLTEIINSKDFRKLPKYSQYDLKHARIEIKNNELFSITVLNDLRSGRLNMKDFFLNTHGEAKKHNRDDIHYGTFINSPDLMPQYRDKYLPVLHRKKSNIQNYILSVKSKGNIYVDMQGIEPK